MAQWHMASPAAQSRASLIIRAAVAATPAPCGNALVAGWRPGTWRLESIRAAVWQDGPATRMRRARPRSSARLQMERNENEGMPLAAFKVRVWDRSSAPLPFPRVRS